MAKKFETVTYTAPACWASYWINSNASGLEDHEIAEADAAFDRILKDYPDAGPHPVDCGENYFAHSHDFTHLTKYAAGDVCDYTFLIQVESADSEDAQEDSDE